MNKLSALAMTGAIAVFALTSHAQTAAPQQKAAAPAAAPATQPKAAAPAAAPAAATNPQQERMKECNVKAEGKKGDERKAFMSTCLSGKDAAPVKMTQQEKMTACNKKAGDMKGDERKKFMSDCLKG